MNDAQSLQNLARQMQNARIEIQRISPGSFFQPDPQNRWHQPLGLVLPQQIVIQPRHAKLRTTGGPVQNQISSLGSIGGGMKSYVRK
jgi:hypothetical protein